MHAPQINTETQWRLNTTAQLNDIQKNYLTFYKDLGDAQRANTVTSADVESMNAIGHRLQTSIENANRLWKAYIAAPSGDMRSQVINALLEAEQILLELTTRKAQAQKVTGVVTGTLKSIPMVVAPRVIVGTFQ